MEASYYDDTSLVVGTGNIKVEIILLWYTFKIKRRPLHYVKYHSIICINKRAPLVGCSFFTVGGTTFEKETPKRILGIVKGRIT